MAEGEQATATATAQGSGADPAQQAAAAQTQTGAGGSAGQGSQQAQAEMISVARSEYDSIKANAGRFQAIQQRGDFDVIRELQDQGLTRQEIADMKSYVKTEFGGMTLKDFFAAFRAPAPSAQAVGTSQAQAQAQTQQDPRQAPLTMADLEKFEQTKQEKAETEAAVKAHKAFWDNVAKEFKADSGAKSKSLRGIIRAAEIKVIADDLQKRDPYLDVDMATKQAEKMIPDEGDLAAALELVKNDWKDLDNEIVSAAAKGQEGLPAGTLGGGAGGSQPPPGKAGQMSETQKQQAILDGIRRTTAAAGYRSPA